MLWNVPKLWEGGRCFIIGGGGSLPRVFGVPEEIISKVQANQLPISTYSPYMRAIHNCHVIGVNMAYELGDWVDICFFGDGIFPIKSPKVKYFPNLKVTCSKQVQEFVGLKFLRKNKKKPLGITTEPTMVSWNHNSGFAAINLAVHLGVKEIILLGFDMGTDPNQQPQWHGVYGKRKQMTGLYQLHSEGEFEIKRDLDKLGVSIHNVSPASSLQSFPRKTLAEVGFNQSMIKPKPQRVIAIGTVYNEMKCLPDMVKYWRAQDIEMYYIDNYSTDGTWEYLQAENIPSHRLDTNQAFDLAAIQDEIEKTLHKLKPDWFIYAAADLYYATDKPLKETISKATIQGYNQITLPCFYAHNTGERRNNQLFGTYYYVSKRKNPLVMISKYHKDISLKGDCIVMPNPNFVGINGMIINFGQTKSKKEREETYKRRQKAWERGLSKHYGAHYLEGQKVNWKWEKDQLIDIRSLNEYKYYEQMRYLLKGEQDTRTKVTILSKKDYAGSGWRIVQDMRLHCNEDFNVDAIVEEANVAFQVPCALPIEQYGREEAETRIRNSDIIHFKGDWPGTDDWAGIEIPKHIPTVQLVSGSFFRQMRPNLQRNVALEKYKLSDYSADFKCATTPDLCYTSEWKYMPFSWFKFNYVWKRSKVFNVVHIPSTPAKKGTAIIDKAMQQVCAMRTDVGYISKTNISYEEMWQYKRSAHLYIDQLVIDAYSNAAVEAMGLGIPVLSALDKTLYDVDCPVIAPEPTVEALVETINYWLDWDRLEELSLRSFEYCKQVHGTMAEKWKQVYESLQGTKVAVVIPTCDPARKPFIDFLEARLLRQTRQPNMVIKIDYPNSNGKPDLAKRYREGCKKAFDAGMDLVVFMEDDDFYPLTYIEDMTKAWEKEGRPAAIGHTNTRYYHLGVKGYKDWGKQPHASAHCTAVSKQANLSVCKDDYISFDIALWKENKSAVKTMLDRFPVSIKHGIGMTAGRKHVVTKYKHFDEDLSVLKQWVDAEAFQFYQTIMNNA